MPIELDPIANECNHAKMLLVKWFKMTIEACIETIVLHKKEFSASW